MFLSLSAAAVKIYPIIAVEFLYMGAIVLFDGVCNFCNGTVNFIIEHDRAGDFKFAPLQSAVGEELMREHGVASAETDSVIVIEDGKALTHSSAAVEIARHLDGIVAMGRRIFKIDPAAGPRYFL